MRKRTAHSHRLTAAATMLLTMLYLPSAILCDLFVAKFRSRLARVEAVDEIQLVIRVGDLEAPGFRDQGHGFRSRNAQAA